MVADKKEAKLWVRQQNALYKKAVWGVVFLGFLNVILGCIQAWFLASALAHILDSSMDGFVQAVLWFFVTCLLRILLNFTQQLIANSLGQKARSQLRKKLLSQIFAAGPALLRSHHSSKVAGLLVDNVEMLEGYFSRWLPSSYLWALAQWFVVAVVFWQNRSAGIILATASLFLPIFQAIFGIATARTSRKQFLALSRLQGRFLDRLRGLATIVMAGRSEQEAEALQKSADELRQRTMKVLRVAFLTSATTDLVMIAALVGIVITESHFLLHTGNISQATNALFAVFMVPEAFAPFRSFSAAYQDRARATETAEVALSLPKPQYDNEQHEFNLGDSEAVELKFDDVSFHWSDDREWVLNHISFTLRPNEILLLNGPSGAGKSTLLELVLGFIKPTNGTIFFNNEDITKIKPKELAHHISYLGQKPLLFFGTLKENILFARPDASEKELQSAIKAAAIDKFLPQLPHNIDTMIGEGGFGLSGGQAQRVAIARAYLKNAPLILMDEPTAHLDKETEAEILSSLTNLAKNRTVIIATHSAQFTALKDVKTLNLPLHQYVTEKGKS
ncbi:thiol reductant ABC exporter subunit CydD [Aristophania vespae]|uniref:Thiol reductant ABC exporter subunit CydD n=1 Tax=Aristophania vespae TaxID=2697033 RepID=A0A6P1NG88_9PROT|nr:thiol reductant ABC exporter subunit CydD [Aristophania vespae]QHI95540.1 thiol reductant ABC exporter subunit CydD [Aristophania vespae]